MIGSRLKAVRKGKGLTQEAAGELADISAKYLGEIEREEANPTSVVIHKLCRAFGVPACQLMEVEDFKECPYIRGNVLTELTDIFQGKTVEEVSSGLALLKQHFQTATDKRPETWRDGMDDKR
jgi:transcriptional regulator with XRE-family HTH domain